MDGAASWPEQVFPRATGLPVLLHGVGHRLPHEAILQLHGGDGQNVYEQSQIDGKLPNGLAVAELEGHRKAVLPMALLGQGVPLRGRTVEQGNFVGAVVNALSEYVDDDAVSYIALEAVEEAVAGRAAGVGHRATAASGCVACRKADSWARSTQRAWS